MLDIPKTFKQRQNSLHLDTLIQIEEILETKSGNVIFSHCYSHTNEEDEKEDDNKLTNEEKISRMINIYGGSPGKKL